MINKSLEANWRSLWLQQGRASAPEFDGNLFGDNIPSLPPEVMRQVKLRLQDVAGFINDNNEGEFMPFVAKIVNDVMRENNYGTTKLGYAPERYTNYNDTVWWKPTSWFDLETAWAIVSRPPENFALDSRGNRDKELMEYVKEDFQVVLDGMANLHNTRGGFSEGDREFRRYRAGVNAGLRYSSELSSAQVNEGVHTPTWEIILVGNDGHSIEILSEDGLFKGRPVEFTLDPARRRLGADKQKELDRINAMTPEERLLLRGIPISP